jgi:DNA-binding CsgD family transcriptional regulator
MHTLEALISRLYRSTRDIDIAHFRAWALSEVQMLIAFDAAIWSTGHLSTRSFHTHTSIGLPRHFPDLLLENLSINPIRKRLFNNVGQAIDMADVVDDTTFFTSDIYHQVFQPHQISRILSSIHICRRTGIYTLLSLYRSDPENRFLETEKQQHQRLLYHLVESASHACILSLKNADEPYACHAICDREGIYHEAEPQFMDLMESTLHVQDTTRFPLDVSCAEQRVKELIIRSQQLGDLFRLSIRESSPMDTLTKREQEVVEGVTQGLSFKQIGRKLALSPSTISNHLYRIYQKLNINNRSELADLINK